MKLNRSLGLGSLAAIALSVALPTAAVAGSEQGQAAEESGNNVHRVVHSLAANEAYTREAGAGYKWNRSVERVDTWADSLEGQTGYKWGNAAAPVNGTAAKNFAEQAGNRWSRRDFSEQAGNRWSRR